MSKPWVPHQYQLEGVKWLVSHLGAGLIADMGLGKSAMTLAAASTLMMTGHVRKILLIGTIRSLYTVWPAEIAKWTDFNGLTYVNCHEDRDGWKGTYDIYAINPESALPLMKNGFLAAQGFDLLVVDESAMFKNPASQRFKALQKILHLFPRRWILTGSISPNGLVDIWSQVYIVDRGEALGKFITHFRNAFCIADWSGFGYTVPSFAAEEIYRRIKPLCISMKNTDYLDMPELVTNEITVILPPAAMKVYKEMEREFLIILEKDTIYSPNAAVAGMRCRQISAGGVYYPDGTVEEIHTVKADALKEIVENLQGQPLLLFYEFKHDITRIRKALGDIPNLMEAKNPTQLVNDFNAGKIPVLMSYPIMALNLQGSCHNVCWFSPTWDLMMYDQANARVWRQGQESGRVVIHHIIAKDTLDHSVVEAISEKRKIQDKLLEAIKLQ
jgi:SNF2 family DNA or RNA helicase